MKEHHFYQSEVKYLELLRELKKHNPRVIVNTVIEEKCVLMHLSGDAPNEDTCTYPVEQTGALADKTAEALIKCLLACCFINEITLSRDVYGLTAMEGRPSEEALERWNQMAKSMFAHSKELEKEVDGAKLKAHELDESGQKAKTPQAQKEQAPKEQAPAHKEPKEPAEDPKIFAMSGLKNNFFFSAKAGIDARLLYLYNSTDEIRVMLRSLQTEANLDAAIKEAGRARVKKEGVIELLYGSTVLEKIKKLDKEGYFEGDVKEVKEKIKREAGLLGSQPVKEEVSKQLDEENDEFEDDEVREITPGAQAPPANTESGEIAPTTSFEPETTQDVSYLDTERKIKELLAFYKMPMPTEDASSERIDLFELMTEVKGFGQAEYDKLANPACKDKYPSLDIMATTAPKDYLDALYALVKEWAARKKVAES